jgi:hypothetical protein
VQPPPAPWPRRCRGGGAGPAGPGGASRCPRWTRPPAAGRADRRAERAPTQAPGGRPCREAAEELCRPASGQARCPPRCGGPGCTARDLAWPCALHWARPGLPFAPGLPRLLRAGLLPRRQERIPRPCLHCSQFDEKILTCFTTFFLQVQGGMHFFSAPGMIQGRDHAEGGDFVVLGWQTWLRIGIV